MKHLISIGWEVIMHTANGKLRHVISAIEPLHVVFVKKSVVIQLVVFYPRGDYLWIGGSISNQTAHLIEGTGMYGRHSAIFNQFQLQHRSILALPVDIPYFIMQMETSRFLECNHHHATRFATLHGDLLFHPNDLTIVSNEAVKSIQVMEHLSRWLNVSIWLWNGSLLSTVMYSVAPLKIIFVCFVLGWFRNCGPFQHMYSLDFALSYEQVEHLNLNLTEELLKFASENGKFFVSNILGSKNSTLEYRMKLRDNSESDLFHFRLLSCFKKKNLTIYHRFEVFSHSSENSSVFETTFVHPLFNVCSADYLGQKVLVPCKAAEIILNGKLLIDTFPSRQGHTTYASLFTIEFGPDWPVAYGPQWDETFSPLNRVNQSKLSGQGLVNFQDETFKESASLKFFFYLVLLALVVGVLLRCRVWRKQKKLM